MSAERLLDYLKKRQLTYTPNESVTHILRTKTAIAIVAPVAAGKSTIMQTMAKLDDDCAVVTSFTTRPPAGKDDPGIHSLPNSEVTLREIKQMTDRGKLVQYAVHPTTGFVYYTDLTSYPKPFNVAPILSSVMPAFEKIPFKACVPIALTAKPGVWQDWFGNRERNSRTYEDDTKRLAEATQSIEWSLGQPGIHWVENVAGHPETAAQEIISITRGKTYNSQAVRKVGKALLQKIVELQNNCS